MFILKFDKHEGHLTCLPVNLTVTLSLRDLVVILFELSQIDERNTPLFRRAVRQFVKYGDQQ